MLQSWLESTGSIARTETAYLSPEDYWDLFNLGPLSEQDFPALYQYIERLLFFLTSGLNKVGFLGLQRQSRRYVLNWG